MGVSVNTALVDALLKSAPRPEKAERADEPAAPVQVRRGSKTVSDWANEARAAAKSAQSLDALADVGKVPVRRGLDRLEIGESTLIGALDDDAVAALVEEFG